MVLTATADLTLSMVADGIDTGMANFSRTTFGWNVADLARLRLIDGALVLVVTVCGVSREGDTPGVVFGGLRDGALVTALSVCCVAGVGDTEVVL